jgi:hypothetical protein
LAVVVDIEVVEVLVRVVDVVVVVVVVRVVVVVAGGIDLFALLAVTVTVFRYFLLQKLCAGS